MKPRWDKVQEEKETDDPEGCCRRVCWFSAPPAGHFTLLLAACNGGWAE